MKRHDRFRVRPDLRLRLAESIETALALSGGLVRVAWMDTPPEGQPQELTFSAAFACPVCGYSIPEPEPRLFSFNNPAGACPSCDGLGVEQFFDPAKVVLHPDCPGSGPCAAGTGATPTISDIRGRNYGFDPKPWEHLPRRCARSSSTAGERGQAAPRSAGPPGGPRGHCPQHGAPLVETDSNTVREVPGTPFHQPCPPAGLGLNEADAMSHRRVSGHRGPSGGRDPGLCEPEPSRPRGKIAAKVIRRS
jgi:excinuclease ABC subunit A